MHIHANLDKMSKVKFGKEICYVEVCFTSIFEILKTYVQYNEELNKYKRCKNTRITISGYIF